MIALTRPNQHPLFVNADLIQSLEREHDTVITLVNGTKLRVEEAPAEIVERIIAFRRQLRPDMGAAEDHHG